MPINIADVAKRYINTYTSMFCKRDKNLWVFGAWFGNKFADNPKYLFLYCLEHGINAVWITRNLEVYEEMSAQGLPVYMQDTREATALCRKAGYCICCTGVEDANRSHLGNAVFINLWHGIPLKKIVNDDIYTKKTFKDKVYRLITALPFRKTYYFSTSDRITQIYKSCFRTDAQHIIQIGQVRNDAFFNGTLKKRSFSSLEYKKLIVYIPTHRNEGKTVIPVNKIFDFEDLNQYCKENEILFLIKKHYYHKDETTDISCYSNIVDYTAIPCDTQELLFNADLLVTDYSSCYIDYLLLDRPIVFYNYDYKEYLLNDREMYFDYGHVTPGYKASSYSDLRKAIELTLNGNTDFKDERSRIKNLFYSKDNQTIVCGKTVDVIKRL